MKRKIRLIWRKAMTDGNGVVHPHSFENRKLLGGLKWK